MIKPPPIQKPTEVPPPAHNYDSLIGGLIFLVLGIGAEVVQHPVTPWTYMPGTVFVMVGLGLALAVLEKQYPKAGRIAHAIALTGVFIWYLPASQVISLLCPALFLAFFQLSRFVLRLTLE